MQIRNCNGLTMAELRNELIAGGRFVTFQYCFSFLLFTFRSTSDVYFIPAGKSAFWQSLPYTLFTILFGWWGLPWGPVHTINTLQTNLQGGTDITEALVQELLFRGEETSPTASLPMRIAA